jgi:hypothetical protein
MVIAGDERCKTPKSQFGGNRGDTAQQSKAV